MRRKSFMKSLSVILVFIMVMALAGCKADTNEKESDSSENKKVEEQNKNNAPNADQGNEENEENNQDEVKGLPPMTTEKIELTYAGWGDDQDVLNALCEAFMEKYPNITVTAVSMNAFTYIDDFYMMAQDGLLPDCFMVMDETGWTVNEWLLDITELYDNDPETQYVYDYCKKLGVYDGVRTMFPTNSLPNIAVLNKDYFDMYNEPLPSYEEWNLDKAIELAEKLTHPEDMRYGFGKATLFNLDLFPLYADPMLNGERGYYGYVDGEGYLFTKDWIDMVELRNDLHARSVFDVATSEQKTAVIGEDVWLPPEGYTAINIDHFWSFDELMQAPFNMIPYPYPVSENGKTPVSSDLVGVSAISKYPREAYEFVKFLTFDREGWDVKIDAYLANSRMPDKMPNTELPESTKEKFYQSFGNREGIDAIFDSIANAVDVSTVTPGLRTFEKWLNDNGYMGQILNWSAPEVFAADIAEELTKKANEYYQSEIDLIYSVVHNLKRYRLEDYGY